MMKEKNEKINKEGGRKKKLFDQKLQCKES
jgi:hypothetical protein